MELELSVGQINSFDVNPAPECKSWEEKGLLSLVISMDIYLELSRVACFRFVDSSFHILVILSHPETLHPASGILCHTSPLVV